MVDFVGIDSVADRTIFTDKGPIVKRPLDVLAGSDLRVVSETIVEIPSGSFTSSLEGMLLAVFGSPGGRNDGLFPVEAVLSPTRLRLSGASLNVLDEVATVALCVALANDLKDQYGLHRTRKVQVSGSPAGVHGTDDTVHVVTAPDATGLASAIVLANDLLAQLNAHMADISGDPRVHRSADSDDAVVSAPAAGLSGLILLLNKLRRSYESHRQNHFVHLHPDVFDRVDAPPVKPVVGTYPGVLTGPFPWTVRDPRYGQVADAPYDVGVSVNGSPAAVDAVFGLIGAVVLSSAPAHGDDVRVDYDWISNPPSRLMRLNSPEFVLNQDGTTPWAGLPRHRYRSRSRLAISSDGPELSSAYQPVRRGWKYKAAERAYTAVLNDPTSLLLNVPTNKISYPVLFERVSEVTVRYDPVTLPQNAMDPWILEGDGTLSLAPGGSALTVVDSSVQTGVDSRPPFFSHALDLRASSSLSSAFRARASADPSVFVPDGVFSGVSFGVSDGKSVALVGFILTDATNLTSAAVMANECREMLNAHLVNVGSHSPDDLSDAVQTVGASSLASLVILANELKARLNSHEAKGGGPGLVHALPDSVNLVLSPDATDLPSAIALINEVRLRLNAHGTQSGVHFVSDPLHQVQLVRQVGLLTSRGFPELASSWESFASDWTQYRTYRLVRDPGGGASVYVSGGVLPAASADVLDLPALSDLDGRFDLVQQAFFGTVGKDSKSSSDWQFVRVNVQPLDADLIENNKQVDYGASVVPELSDPPWTTYGAGGVERAESGVLVLDSTSSAAPVDVPALGLVSGAYRGFVRLEPILSVDTASVVEFRMSADFWTHSVSNRAFGLFTDDSDFTVQLAFLQASPSPATVTGTVSDPFVLVTGDSIVLQVGADTPVSVTFSLPPDVNTAAGVASRINAVVGFPLASAVSGRVRLTSEDVGASASFTVISGSALAKLGFSPGPYFGRDSNPEPKISWFGANLPELDDPVWIRGGAQPASLFGRTLRVSDTSLSDYAVWTVSDPLVTNQVLSPGTDWKVDFRLGILTFAPGPTIPASGPYQALDFAGALVSVDEGPSGKTLELHLAVDGSGSQFLNLLSYNSLTGSLDVVSQYAFSWNDGAVHSFDVYTSKAADSVIVLADSDPLTPSAGPAPTYSGLNSGVSGPSLSFGSGAEPVTGADLRVCRSVVDWESVSAFRDSKVSDPSAASRRYVGLFRGGAPDVLSSYYLHQVDWASLHIYRISRDPSSGVQVYLDGSATPAISAAYDVLTLPPASSSFLAEATSGNPAVAFGAFSPSEISRTRWDFVRYSVGKITLTDRIVPPHQVLNQSNAVSSPDHLRTQLPHGHQGFTVYSGGTPTDEFLAREDLPAYTVLGDRTPTVPATQNLETRRGMVKVATPLKSVAALDAVNQDGFLSDLQDDVVNVAEDPYVSVSDAEALVVGLANDLRAQYEAHRTRSGVHSVNDLVNFVTAVAAGDIVQAVALLNNIKSKFNLHRSQAGVHVPNDPSHEVTAPDATDLPSAAVLADALLSAYSSHAGTGAYHLVPDSVDTVSAADPTDLLSAARIASTIADSLAAHALSTSFHEVADLLNGKFASVLPGVGKAGVTGLGVMVTSDALDAGQLVVFLDGPNAGQERTVLGRLSQLEYEVIPDFPLDDLAGSRFTRLGRKTLSAGTAASGPGYSTISVTGPSVIPAAGDAFIFLDGPNAGERRSVTSSGPSSFVVTPVLPVNDVDPRSFSIVSSPSVPGVDPAYVVSLSNSLKRRFNSHRTRPGVHRTDDVLDVVTSSDAAVLEDTYPLLAELKDELNSHLSGYYVHVTEDVVDVVTAPEAVDVLAASVESVNSCRSAYLAHVVATRVHLQDDDVNVVLPPDAFDLDSGCELANALKAVLNRHFVALVHEVVGSPVQRVHSSDDVVNDIPAADATDLPTFVELAHAVSSSYNAHRTQAGVHGSTLFIRLEPPHRVLYEGMKFWNVESGDPMAGVYPFSDDETLHIDGSVSYAGVHSYSFVGDVLPGDDVLRKVVDLANDLKAVYNAHRVRVGIHSLNDTFNVVTAPNATDLPSACVLLAQLKSVFTSHLSQPSVHLASDSVDAIVASDGSALAMAVSLAMEIRMKFDLHRVSEEYHLLADYDSAPTAPDPPPPADPGWVLVKEGLGLAPVSLITSPEDAVRFGVTAPGAVAVYRKATGLPDGPSVAFDFEVRMRVSSFVYSPDVETGIYAGFLSSAGPGVAAAVGFDALHNVPYVKIQDVNSDRPVLRIPFNWADGAFHTYRVSRDPETDSLSLTVVD